MEFSPRMRAFFSRRERIADGPCLNLFDAAIAGDVDEAQRFLARGDVIDATDPMRSFSPLICAATFGNISVVRLLLAHGASHAPLTYSFQSPLMQALRDGHLACADVLWDAGCRAENAENMVFHVLNYKAPIAALDWLRAHIEVDLGRALHSALRARYIEGIDWLLALGADVNARWLGETPLMVAAETGQMQLIERILAVEPDVFATNSNGDTALDYAIYSTDIHDPELVRDGGEGSGPTAELFRARGLSAKR